MFAKIVARSGLEVVVDRLTHLGRGKGKAPEQDLLNVVLSPELSKVSRNHALLIRSRKKWSIQKIAPHNRLYVNGQLVESTAEIPDGAVIQLSKAEERSAAFFFRYLAPGEYRTSAFMGDTTESVSSEVSRVRGHFQRVAGLSESEIRSLPGMTSESIISYLESLARTAHRESTHYVYVTGKNDGEGNFHTRGGPLYLEPIFRAFGEVRGKKIVVLDTTNIPETVRQSLPEDTAIINPQRGNRTREYLSDVLGFLHAADANMQGAYLGYEFSVRAPSQHSRTYSLSLPPPQRSTSDSIPTQPWTGRVPSPS